MNSSPMQPLCVEVFRTNIPNTEIADKVVRILQTLFQPHRINIDLDDCDKVLRIEANHINSSEVIDAVYRLGYTCQVME
jgi:hypothetical protein